VRHNQKLESKENAKLCISNQVLQKLSEIRIQFIIQLCDAVLRQDFFPSQWKIAQIIMIQKPGKSAEIAES